MPDMGPTVLVDERVEQYGTTGRCVKCGNPLSRYNPYTVCGPCRVRIAEQEAIALQSISEEQSHDWERFERREPVQEPPIILRFNEDLCD